MLVCPRSETGLTVVAIRDSVQTHIGEFLELIVLRCPPYVCWSLLRRGHPPRLQQSPSGNHTVLDIAEEVTVANYGVVDDVFEVK